MADEQLALPISVPRVEPPPAPPVDPAVARARETMRQIEDALRRNRGMTQAAVDEREGR